MVLEHFEHSSQKSTKQCARETGISRTSVLRIIKTAKLKVFIPRLLYALNEDGPDWRMQYCEWFRNMVQQDEAFIGKVVWSDETQFKLNGTVNWQNCLYWCANNQHFFFLMTVNLPGINVWCGLSSRGLFGLFFFLWNSNYSSVPEHVTHISLTRHLYTLWK